MIVLWRIQITSGQQIISHAQARLLMGAPKMDVGKELIRENLQEHSP